MIKARVSFVLKHGPVFTGKSQSEIRVGIGKNLTMSEQTTLEEIISTSKFMIVVSSEAIQKIENKTKERILEKMASEKCLEGITNLGNITKERILKSVSSISADFASSST